jgi:hypothetical protein
MRKFMVGRLACLTAAVVITVGQPAFATSPAASRSADVTLAAGGVLNGTVVTSTAQPVSATKVTILHGDTTVAEAVTNEAGEFAVKGLRNGAHTVKLANATQPVRFWSASAAPPGANGKLVLVSSPRTVRAQDGGGMGLVGTGLLFGGALAVTLATTLNDKNDPPAVSSP